MKRIHLLSPGIVEIKRATPVWLTVRSEGKWLRLFEGETFPGRFV